MSEGLCEPSDTPVKMGIERRTCPVPVEDMVCTPLVHLPPCQCTASCIGVGCSATKIFLPESRLGRVSAEKMGFTQTYSRDKKTVSVLQTLKN